MLRVSLAQMRRSAGRLIAAGIAIAIGTAFVAASLFGGSVISATTARSLTAELGDADIVVQGHATTSEMASEIADIPGVDTAFGRVSAFEEVGFEGRTEYTLVQTPAPSAKLEVLTIEAGEKPAALDEIALPVDTMNRLHIEIGDEVTVPIYTYTEDENGATTEEKTERTLTVTGSTADPNGAYISYGGAALVTPETQSEFLGVDADYPPDNITVAVSEDANVADVKQEISQRFASEDGGVIVRTASEQVEAATAEVTGDTNILLVVVLAFAVVALFVAGLVITNTFQVLVAQRTRQLALLRCVGATKAQVSRSITLESFILGLIASASGLALGAALIQGTLTILSRQDIGVPLPEAITLSPVNILVPILTGTIVTLLAALGPARAATRVAPLAALRPASSPEVRSKAGRFRLVISLLGMIGGGALLILGVMLAKQEPLLGFFVAVLGGMSSFIGVIIGGVFVIPKVVGFFGGLLGRMTGATSKIATANTVRNPRRTAATATALLIGVTLVTMMSTGAAIARTTLNSALIDQFPVDVAIGQTVHNSPVIDARIAPEMAKLTGIESVAELPTAPVEVEITAGGGIIHSTSMSATGVDQAAADAVANDGSLPVDRGEVLVGNNSGNELGMWSEDPAETIIVSGPDGDVTLNVVGTTHYSQQGLLLNDQDFEDIAGDAEIHALWMSTDDAHPAVDTYNSVNERLSELTGDTESNYLVTGSAVERGMFEQIIDTLLLIVVGLLAVAVVIALIGVANTLSLSVIERRRESALLRALGLTRGRLRLMLAIEALLITGVGALLGVVLGLIYGFAGASVIFGEMTSTGLELTIPWRDIALVLIVALLAGLLASVMPARSATKTPPVAALAED